MSKLNLLVHINGYEDENCTNNPSRNNFKWNRDTQGVDIEEPSSKSISLAPGQTHSLFSGAVVTSDDGTTTWDIALKAGTTNTYRISLNSGTAPEFRTARTTGADATTAVTVTKNAKVLTFTSTAGTALDLIAGGAIVGDIVRIGSSFNAVNQGKYTIIALSATSLSIENESGQAEGPIVLGASFEDELSVHSQNGVQIGDKVDIVDGFSPVSRNTYEITDATPEYIEFFSLDSLPAETAISNSPAALFIYRDAKQFIYVETNQKILLKLDNGTITKTIEPLTAGTTKKPGMFLATGTVKSAEIENTSQSFASIFYVTAE